MLCESVQAKLDRAVGVLVGVATLSSVQCSVARCYVHSVEELEPEDTMDENGNEIVVFFIITSAG